MDEILAQAIAAIKVGDITVGKRLLYKILQENPGNESAWLWMSKCVSNPEQKRECFERVLEINLNNQHAIDGLKRLDTLSDIKTPQSGTPKKQTTKISQNKKSSNNRILLLILAIIVICLCGVSIALISSDDENSGASRSRASINSTIRGSNVTNANESSIIIDVPYLLTQSLDQIRAKYIIAPYEELHPLFGYEEVLPTGKMSEGYTDGKYSFYLFYNSKNKVVGFQIYDGLENSKFRVSDWREVLKLFNVTVNQSPDFINAYRAEWNNNSGYHIEIVRHLSTDYVFLVFICVVR